MGNRVEEVHVVVDDFAGRVAIVTGATRGIGLASATELGRRGARLVLNARKQDELDDVLAGLADDGIEAVAVAGSVMDDVVPVALVDAAVEHFGRLDHLVNNVGMSPYYGPLLGADRARVVRTLEGNTWPTLALVQAAMARGLADGGGSIVNISTIGARQTHPLTAVYCAAKAALESLSRVLARELGPLGVRVNVVAPGLVRTEMARVLWDGGKEQGESEIIPLQRIGDPVDIGRVVAFALSDEAGWMTGATLDVDGGRTIIGGEPRDLYGVMRDLDQHV